MPKLGNHEELKQIFLPSTQDLPQEDQAWITMDVSPQKAGDFYNLDDSVRGHITFAVLLERVREWNYEDEDGNVLPITLDNLKRLNADDFAHLQTQIMDGNTRKMDEEQKKSSSPTSSPAVSVPVEVQ